MKTFLKWILRLLILALLGVIGVGSVLGWAWWRVHEPWGDGMEHRLTIHSGQGASAILEDLADEGLLYDTRLARLYLIHKLGDPPLIAGEYVFEEPLSTPQVLDKLIRGEIVTWPMTLIEGLTLDEAADMIAEQGFGKRERLREEMRLPDRIVDLDPQAIDLEGYVYPDTYHFARGISEKELVDVLVSTFRRRFAEVSATRTPEDTRTVREIVTLASIVEKEALLDEERPLIAGVYAHRLRRGIALYADPTVIFALKLLGVWDGNVRKADLKLDSPYNTYVYPGLPPGPICSPAVKSLAAAISPEDTKHLYFVSRNDGSHVFASSLAEHNRNVDKWQRQYWRKRWAEERRQRDGKK